MKFKDFLTEKAEKHGVMAFGRMNPVTQGHEKLVDKVKEVAETVGGSAHIVVSHSQDAKKNPLTAAQKVKHAKRAFPGVNISSSDASAPNFLAQAAKLHKAGVTHFHMVGGSDRVDEFYKLLHKYNGVKGPHGHFNFKHIAVHSAGERDPDAEGVEGMSASKMREHASKGNFKEFRKGVPSRMTDAHAKEMYNHVRKGMGLKEDLDVDFEEFLDESFSLSKTFDFIKKAHKGQKYGEMDYWNHPKSVAFFGKKFFKHKFDDKAMKAALLHDVIEDTPYSDQQLVKMGFEKDVIDAVKLLTKNKSLSYEDNIKKIISSGNKTAMMVKFADNYKNYTGDKSDWPEEKKQSSQKKYRNSLEMLAQKLGVKVPVSESLDEDFEQFLTEGVHDKGIFKAVFLFGGPGSGKDYVLSRTLDGHGLVEINSDKAFEFLMDKENLDMRMPENERERRDAVRGRAKNMTELRQRLALFGRNGLIINGTGDDVEKIAKIKERLENLGYESSGIMVNTADEVSKQRNIERGQRGGRTVPEEIRADKWQKVQNARPELAKMFGDGYSEFDNSEDLRTADPQTVQAKEKELMDLYKGVQKFVTKPPKNPNAKLWVASELEKKDTLPIDTKKEVTPHEGSKAAEQAREMGLQYFGFGRYGKNGKVTHRSVHDKLVEVQPQGETNTKMPVAGTSMSRPAKKSKPKQDAFDKMMKEEMLSESVTVSITADTPEEINQMFSQMFNSPMSHEESFMSGKDAENMLLLGTKKTVTEIKDNNVTFSNEDVAQIFEKKEDKYITDKHGKPRVFMLRAAAAKEAHTHNGLIVKSERGYLIKLKENEDVQMVNGNIFEETGRDCVGGTNTQGTTKTSRLDETGRKEEGNFLCEETGTKETTVYKKITIAEIRKRQEEKVIESIDKGIEPGVSMSGSGESVGRDTGEKIKKRTGKASQVTEMTGDETTASIGDQKEDELKKKGISLTSFKKRNFV
jgi:hypothetical protein